MDRSDLDKDSLKIGDYVTLRDVALGCFLYVEGILLEERQYSAARELAAFLDKYSSDPDNIKDESERKYLQALERGRDNENALNDQYLKKKMGQVVLFGEVIQLYHVKSGKYLQIFPNKLARDERDNVRIGLDQNGDAYSWIQICPRYKIDRDGDRILSNAEVFLKVAERSAQLGGGPFKWKTDQVRFRHVNSGRYMVCETDVSYDEQGNLLRHGFFTVTDNIQHPGTLFNVSEMNSTAKYLGNVKALQIGHNGMWIERGEVLKGGMFTFSVVGSKEKGNALNLVAQRYKYSKSGKDGENDYDYVDPSLRLDQPLDLYVGLSIRDYLRKYYDMTVISSRAELNTLWPTASRTDIETFKVVVEKIVAFLLGHPIGTILESDALEVADSKLMVFRQTLLREQGAVEILLRFMQKLLPLVEAGETRKKKKVNTDRSFLFRMVHLVLHECFSVMLRVLKENPENQMFAADFMPLFLANLSSQPLAVDCVTEMLNKNIELQETKIGAREIQIFVDKLKASQLNTMYLQLLQSCCSCQGKGVDGNQCKVANMLFQNTDNIIIGLNADYAHCTPVDWGEKEKWLTSEEEIGNSNYIASLEESFSTGSFVMQRETFNLNLSAKSSMVGSTRQHHMAAQQKREIGRFFIAEMFLGAEMCLDRNYVAMQKLEDIFPYDVLLSIMKLNVADSLKAAAVRLLMCLHVDRDPQATTKIPCLTRTWSEIRKQTEPQLPFVESNRQYLFGIIQHLISEHIHNMVGNKWNDLSMHMLKILRALISFNFYGTKERMQDIIQPLIAALDRRHLTFDHSMGPSARMGKIPPTLSASKKSSRKSFMEEILEGNEEEVVEVNTDNSEALRAIDRLVTRDDENGYEGEEGEEDDDYSLSSRANLRRSMKYGWQYAFYENLLQRMQSTLASAIIIIAICLATVLDIYQIVSGESYRDYGVVSIIELVILSLFVAEMIVKLYTYRRVHSTWREFFADPINTVDLAVTITNFVLYFTTSLIDEGLSFIKLARLVRIIPLLRMRVDAKVDIASGEAEGKVDQFVIPKRFSTAPVSELETMVEAVDILAFIEQVIEDRNLSLFLRYFYLWEAGNDRRNPPEIFEQVIEDSNALSLNMEDFENVMMDLIMYNHHGLVQSALEVLMAFFSRRSLVLEHAKYVQLLASSKREKQFQIVNKMLKQLEQNAETHELWGELETESDHA
eukprot:scaffold2674_cov159-Ochromonas_danica.AAC.3